MQEKTSRAEIYNFYNSLAGLLKSLEKSRTIIDLRNESCVSGLIENVDGFMNVEMTDVVFYDARGNEHNFETFHISARNIRYVHIPKGLSAKELMENQLARMQRPERPRKQKLTHKMKRTIKYNEETKETMYNQAGPSNT